MPELTATTARLVLGAAVLTWIAARTVGRFAGEDDDPSVSVGGDWAVVRASGPALIALAGLVALAAFAPEILSGEAPVLAGGVAGVVALWGVAKWRDA